MRETSKQTARVFVKRTYNVRETNAPSTEKPIYIYII